MGRSSGTAGVTRRRELSGLRRGHVIGGVLLALASGCGGPAVEGSARCSDATGDERFSPAARALARPDQDLNEVRLTAGGRSIQIEFVMAGPIADPDTLAPSILLSWSLWMQNEGGKGYLVAVGRARNRTAEAFVYQEGQRDFRRSRRLPSTVDGRTMKVVVPLSDIPDLRAPFRWYASTLLSITRQTLQRGLDYCPEPSRKTGSFPVGSMTRFPQPEQ